METMSLGELCAKAEWEGGVAGLMDWGSPEVVDRTTADGEEFYQLWVIVGPAIERMGDILSAYEGGSLTV